MARAVPPFHPLHVEFILDKLFLSTFQSTILLS